MANTYAWVIDPNSLYLQAGSCDSDRQAMCWVSSPTVHCRQLYNDLNDYSLHRVQPGSAMQDQPASIHKSVLSVLSHKRESSQMCIANLQEELKKDKKKMQMQSKKSRHTHQL